MAIFSKHLSSFVDSLTAAFKEGSDIQTIAIALAISVSLLCSLILLFANLISRLSTEKPCTNFYRPEGKRLGIKRGPVSHPRSSILKQKRHSRPELQLYHVYQKPYTPHTVHTCPTCSKRDQTCACPRKENTLSLNHHSRDEINLSNQGLRTCPARIGYSGPQVEGLTLSHNLLSSLPEEIGCLQGLTRLDLSHNKLIYLPDCLGNLAMLKVLNLCNNKLKTLPDSCLRLQMLSELQLAHNQLEKCPAVICTLNRLNILVLSHNHIERLPCELCSLTNLRKLNVSHNPLTSLPDNVDAMIQLRVINVSSCQLMALPTGITWCVSLARLDVSHNKLTQLPTGMGRLHQLSQLYIQHNQLQYLPMSMLLFMTQTQVKTLSVQGNCFIPKEKQQVFLKENSPARKPAALGKPYMMSLQEHAAKSIILNKINWKRENIACVLKDMLGNVRRCDLCDVPMFDVFHQQLCFHSFPSQPTLPFYEHTCCLHTTDVLGCGSALLSL